MRPSYALLIRAMFQSIERLASTDAKHGDRLRLESYAFFVVNVSEAAQSEPVLMTHVRQAAAAKQRAMQVYVQQQLEHGKFWKLMEFSMVSTWCKCMTVEISCTHSSTICVMGCAWLNSVPCVSKVLTFSLPCCFRSF